MKKMEISSLNFNENIGSPLSRFLILCVLLLFKYIGDYLLVRELV